MANSTDHQTLRLAPGATGATASAANTDSSFPDAHDTDSGWTESGATRDSRPETLPPISNNWRGLFWCEWFSQSRLLLAFSLIWLVCVWILPLFANPGWILLLSAGYALLAGPAFGGGDTIEGCEEFSLSLPPSRGQRFLARFAVGGGTVCLFTVLDMLVLGLDLPQALARVYIDAGLIQPLPNLNPGFLYGLVAVIPISIFSFAFVLSAIARNRTLVFTAWFWAGLITLFNLRISLLLEESIWNDWNGYIACPVLVAAFTVAVACGFRLYLRKEIGPGVTPAALPNHWWVWIVIVSVGIALALFLLTSLVNEFSRLLEG